MDAWTGASTAVLLAGFALYFSAAEDSPQARCARSVCHKHILYLYLYLYFQFDLACLALFST